MAAVAPRTRAQALPGRPAPVPPVALELVGRACSGLRDAGAAQDPGERYVTAHLAALRAAAAVLAVRTPPTTRRRRPVNVWDSLTSLVPELSAWSAYFAAGAARRAAVEAGRGTAVTEAEAVEHVRGAEAFTELVTEMLGTPAQHPLPLAAS